MGRKESMTCSEAGEATGLPLEGGDELMTYAEVGEVTGLPPGTLYGMVAKKQIPHVRLGKRLVRFPRAEIQRWLKVHTVAARTEVSR